MLPAIYSGQSFDSKRGCIAPIECDTRKDCFPIRRSISHPDARIDNCCDVALLVNGMKVFAKASKMESPIRPDPGHWVWFWDCG